MYAYCQDMPGVTEEQARKVEDEVGPEPVEGCLTHVSGPYEGGWRIIDVWESREAQARFQSERLMPAVARAHGGTTRPEPFDIREVTAVFEYAGS